MASVGADIDAVNSRRDGGHNVEVRPLAVT